LTNDETIEFVLYHTDEIRRAIAEKRLDPCLPRTIGHSSKISDITAAAAITNISDVPCVVIGYGAKINGQGNTQVVKRPEMWLRVVKYLDEIYAGKLTEEIIKRRYAQGESQRETCKALGISRDIYFAYRRDWLRAAELYAVGTGLLPYKRLRSENK
jgi:hypothetical protein